MTGEMHESEVTEDAFPMHFAIVKEFGGVVRPFDQYQGPFVFIRGRGKFWICADDDSGFGYVYGEKRDRKSTPFLVYGELANECAVNAVYEIESGAPCP